MTRSRRWLEIAIVYVLICIVADWIFNRRVHFEDVSDRPEYAALVGQHLVSTAEARIYGISNDRNYAPVLGGFVVTGLPGIGGPEVLSEASLPKGTIIEVLEIRRCTDCYLDFGERLELLLKIESASGFETAPVSMDMKYLQETDPLFRAVSEDERGFKPLPPAPSF